MRGICFRGIKVTAIKWAPAQALWVKAQMSEEERKCI